MPIACENVHAAVGEYQRNFIYKIFIETIPEVLKTKFPQAVDFQSKVDLYNSKAIFPDRKTSKIKISWCGEYFNIPGVDESTRDTDLEFYEDEPMWVYDFFDALKDLTGNEYNQAGVKGVAGKFNIGVAQVSVDKETITNYRRLIGVRVYESDVGETDKSGSDVNKMRINIAWDRNYNDKSMRGKTV